MLLASKNPAARVNLGSLIIPTAIWDLLAIAGVPAFKNKYLISSCPGQAESCLAENGGRPGGHPPPSAARGVLGASCKINTIATCVGLDCGHDAWRRLRVGRHVMDGPLHFDEDVGNAEAKKQ